MVVVNTRAGAAGITLPVVATVTVNIPDIENLIGVPAIALSVNLGSKSVPFSLMIYSTVITSVTMKPSRMLLLPTFT